MREMVWRKEVFERFWRRGLSRDSNWLDHGSVFMSPDMARAALVLSLFLFWGFGNEDWVWVWRRSGFSGSGSGFGLGWVGLDLKRWAKVSGEEEER